MAKGHKTGGRQKGTPNKRTAETIAKVEASGLMPLDYMLAVLRDESVPSQERMEAAKNAAPYVHSKMSTVEMTGKDGQPIQTQTEITIRFVKPTKD